MSLVENQFGHGALKPTYDARDHKVENLGMAVIPFDWEVGFDIEKNLNAPIQPENQGQSYSCGGQAARYYLGVLKALQEGHYERLSAKDPYSQIFYPGGGTTVRDLGSICVNKGLTTESLIPSYENNNPPSEAFMEDKIPSSKVSDSHRWVELAYAFPKINIDSFAQSIRDCNGMIIQLQGENNGTWLSAYPLPPKNPSWSHFVYAGKVKMMNGKKYIGILNSWGNIGENGWQWISEDYFPYIQSGLVFYDKTTYTYTPSTTQKALTWLQKFVEWFRLYWKT